VSVFTKGVPSFQIRPSSAASCVQALHAPAFDSFSQE